jgi:hypothetical protein
MNDRRIRKILPRRAHRAARAASVAGMLVAGTLFAGGTWAEGRRLAAMDPEWAAECGSCHLAYPPALMSAAEWSRIMNTLPRHFGVDASVDDDTHRRLGAFLARHAGTGGEKRRHDAGEGRARSVRVTPEAVNGSAAAAAKPGDAAELPRITTSTWFFREHRKVRPTTWGLPSVRGGVHCAACHPGAARGDFAEDDIRIPSPGEARS